MAIEWNTVTWYSKAIAVALYVVTFAVAFVLGVNFQKFIEEQHRHTPPVGGYTDRMVPPTEPPMEEVCSSDAMLCPDGTSVGRTGPHCEFAKCPPAPSAVEGDPSGTPDDDAVFCTMDAKQCPDGSYVGRVGPNCEFAPCP